MCCCCCCCSPSFLFITNAPLSVSKFFLCYGYENYEYFAAFFLIFMNGTQFSRRRQLFSRLTASQQVGVGKIFSQMLLRYKFKCFMVYRLTKLTIEFCVKKTFHDIDWKGLLNIKCRLLENSWCWKKNTTATMKRQVLGTQFFMVICRLIYCSEWKVDRKRFLTLFRSDELIYRAPNRCCALD